MWKKKNRLRVTRESIDGHFRALNIYCGLNQPLCLHKRKLFNIGFLQRQLFSIYFFHYFFGAKRKENEDEKRGKRKLYNFNHQLCHKAQRE